MTTAAVSTGSSARSAGRCRFLPYHCFVFTTADRVLVVAPHPDDETLGVGGTIARLVSEGVPVHVAVVTGHGGDWNPIGPPEKWDITRGECKQAMDVLGVDQLHFRELPTAMLANHPIWETNSTIWELIQQIQPTVMFVPFQFDLHKDHRAVFDALSVTWRASSEVGRCMRLVLAYEVPSETHWNSPYLEAGFLPNLWVDISEHLDTKMRALACYPSQLRPFPDARSLEAVTHLARWRGSQQSMSAAEAFIIIRALALGTAGDTPK